LRVLKLYGIRGLHDLHALTFLTGPGELRVEDARLLNIDAVERWAGTLLHLVLRKCGTLDIGPIAALRNLVKLDLAHTTVFDLRPLAGLSLLERLVVSSTRDPRALAPIAGLPNLKEIAFTEGSPVNLAAFAGRRGLLVKVQGLMTKVVGAELLGEGSAVEVVSTVSQRVSP
jgi:hypothetical protein